MRLAHGKMATRYLRITTDLNRWTRNAEGEWVSDNGKWLVQRWGRKWALRHRSTVDDRWALFGPEEERIPWGKDYVPFGTLSDAIVYAEEHQFRGFC